MEWLLCMWKIIQIYQYVSCSMKILGLWNVAHFFNLDFVHLFELITLQGWKSRVHFTRWVEEQARRWREKLLNPDGLNLAIGCEKVMWGISLHLQVCGSVTFCDRVNVWLCGVWLCGFKVPKAIEKDDSRDARRVNTNRVFSKFPGKIYV